MNSTLLQVKKNLKAKKPHFLRQDGHKKVKLGDTWRSSKGGGSKMRICLKGYRRNPNPGWGSPKAVYGYDYTGLIPVYVETIADVEKLNPATQGGIIRAGVGARKRFEIVKIAMAKGVTLLNARNPQKYIDSVNLIMSKRKENSAKKVKARESKPKDSKRVSEKAAKHELAGDDLAVTVSEEDKKINEKKVKDKVLTKKDSM